MITCPCARPAEFAVRIGTSREGSLLYRCANHLGETVENIRFTTMRVPAVRELREGE
jgi:hypothetical protein